MMKKSFARIVSEAYDSEDQEALIILAVSEMALSGLSEFEIARNLSITPSFAKHIVGKCKEMWVERAVQNGGDMLARELEHLEMLRRSAYADYQMSRVSMIAKMTADATHTEPEPDQPGDPRLLSALLSISERISKLLGLDKVKPVQVNLNTMTYEQLKSLDTAELARMYSEEVRKSTATPE